MSVSAKVRTMEVKKTHQPSVANGVKGGDASLDREKLFRFFGEVKAEFRKISWTEREELILSTKAVVGAAFLLGIAVYCVDLGVRASLFLLESFFRVAFG